MGTSPAAATWMKKLDGHLLKHGAEIDIVDMVTCEELEGIDLPFNFSTISTF